MISQQKKNSISHSFGVVEVGTKNSLFAQNTKPKLNFEFIKSEVKKLDISKKPITCTMTWFQNNIISGFPSYLHGVAFLKNSNTVLGLLIPVTICGFSLYSGLGIVKNLLWWYCDEYIELENFVINSKLKTFILTVIRDVTIPRLFSFKGVVKKLGRNR